MAVERFEIVRREPYLDGQKFGSVGAYERIDAIAHYAVDPALPPNRNITDLGLAAEDAVAFVVVARWTTAMTARLTGRRRSWKPC